MSVFELVGVEDIERLHSGPFSDAERERAESLLRLASVKLARRLPAWRAKATLSEDELTLLVGALARIVLRVLRSPEGVESATDTAGIFTQTTKFRNADDVLIFDSDIVDLLPVTPHRRVGQMRAGLSYWQVP